MVLFFILIFFFFLVGYVEERPWWPIQSPNKGRKKKAFLPGDRIFKWIFIIKISSEITPLTSF